jgi:hypothetical protein
MTRLVLQRSGVMGMIIPIDERADYTTVSRRLLVDTTSASESNDQFWNQMDGLRLGFSAV